MKINNPYGIGRKAYPLDNSYAYNTETGINEYLTGILDGEPKLVQIISPPFLMDVNNSVGNIVKKEMVKVKYNNQIHIVLNIFSDKKTY